MATLLLTAAGTLIGGPLGGAIGALAGRQIDGAIIGGSQREGPRLKELDISTSSYGSPITRHHGVSRSGGSIIWATDLMENSEQGGGGKGQPSTTTYSYSTSFAVALSSRPIKGVGRIWADGNLLRGAAGDLKTGGVFRLHTGEADQQPDPLIASAEGTSAPAFRGTAYAVFEDLQLGEFGNRIPALTFEIRADDGDVDLADIMAVPGADHPGLTQLDGLAGFAVETGSTARSLALLEQLYPLSIEAAGTGLLVTRLLSPPDPSSIRSLPDERIAAWDKADFGPGDGVASRRSRGDRPAIAGVRHYDPARDYQPGIQRTDGRAIPGEPSIIEFPATLSAPQAKALAVQASRRLDAEADRIAWRMTQIDPAIQAGSIVRLPGKSGTYRVTAWEWRERAVELELVRMPGAAGGLAAADPGQIAPPADIAAGASVLTAFGLPWDGSGHAGSQQVFAALTTSPAGRSAMLYYSEQEQLRPLASARGDAIQGTLTQALGGSPAMRFEGAARLEVKLSGDTARLVPATLEALANGANRILVGAEIVQFAHPVDLGDGHWRLEGLLRGRGASEASAIEGHAAGTRVVLLDDRLIALGPETVAPGSPIIAANALGDSQPVEAIVDDGARALRPPSPVHPQFRHLPNGDLSLCWIRRARGAWTWPGGVDAPLVEETESYIVGVGPVDSPLVSWTAYAPVLTLDAQAASDIAQQHSGQPVWVRQQGTYAASAALHLGTL